MSEICERCRLPIDEHEEWCIQKSKDDEIERLKSELAMMTANYLGVCGMTHAIDESRKLLSDKMVFTDELVEEEEMTDIFDDALEITKESVAAILNEDAVIDIRRRVAAGEKRSVVADDFGVVESTVSAIINGQTWGWLETCEGCGGSKFHTVGWLRTVNYEESCRRCNGKGWVKK